MNRDEQIKLITGFVKKQIESYDSGHDWWHIERVRRIALFINEKESLADPFTLEIAALLHDTVDSKFAGSNSENCYLTIRKLLDKIGLTIIKNQVVEVIRNVSFSNMNKSGNLKDPVLLILQDADKLDAIGAIGIARAFNYGGFRNNSIHIPHDQHVIKSKSTIDHFYDKLLKLKDMMNTHTGRRMAEERHIFLEIFLKQFYREWTQVNDKNI